MSTNAIPPAWAEKLLRAVLKRTDVDTVSGDLLEEYRETWYPAKGQDAANRWYVRQALGFAMRSVRVWGALFGTAAVVRTALDWFVPATDFWFRSSVSTYLGISLLLMAGFSAAWRSGSVVSGTLAAILAAVIGAFIDIAGTGAMLAVFHDPQTMSAIQGSGGLAEAFTLPAMMVIPALVLGTLGGALGAAAIRIPHH